MPLNGGESQNMSETIESTRLLLPLMGTPVLQALLGGDRITAGRLLGCHVPPDLPLSDMPLARRLKQLRADPAVAPWLLRAMVDRASKTMIGRIGFHSPPRPDDLADLADVAPDAVELGYGVHAPFRRKGYAREAVIALMHWAYVHHDQRCFVLSVSAQNVASTALAEALGFVRHGSHVDEQDGLEYFFVRRFERWPPDWPVGTPPPA